MTKTMLRLCLSIMFFFIVVSCRNTPNTSFVSKKSVPEVVGAMKDAMWKGEISGKVRLDTLGSKAPLYGVGPMAFMRGEIMLLDGEAYVSEVLSDSTMRVSVVPEVMAPFFVYAEVSEWEPMAIPSEVQTIADFEAFLQNTSEAISEPFAFQIKGTVSEATIHVQNLPPGTVVTTPQEAHQGQVSYSLQKEQVVIVGFFSTEHQGVFTHHDSFLHMHLMNTERTKMGHLDAVTLDKATLLLPK